MAVNFAGHNFNVQEETITGRVRSRSLGGHRWEWAARYNQMTYSNFQPIRAFIETQRGSVETFTIVLPIISEMSGTTSGAVTVSGSHSVGETAITLVGANIDLRAGDMLVFSNHTKAYMVVDDRVGAGDVSIHPPLQSALSGAESVTYDNVPITARLRNDRHEFSLGLPSIAEFQIEMIEAV
jgi:hypothetical protein